MSITVDEFLKLKAICEPKSRLHLEVPLTDELISEAARRLPAFHVSRLEMVKNVPREEWPKFEFPRKDGLGNLKPDGVIQAVRHVYWKLEKTVERVAREKAASEPVLARPAEDGTVQCPWCGRTLVLPKGMAGGLSHDQ